MAVAGRLGLCVVAILALVWLLCAGAHAQQVAPASSGGTYEITLGDVGVCLSALDEA